MIGKGYDNMKHETIPYLNMVDIVDFVKFSSLAGLPAGHLPAYILTSGLAAEVETVVQRCNVCIPPGVFWFESVCARTLFFSIFWKSDKSTNLQIH